MSTSGGQNQIFTVTQRDEGLRADVYLASALTGVSRSRIQGLIQNGDILINGLPGKRSAKLEEGDRIECRIPAPAPLALEPVPMDLHILFEDDCFLVINKPRGLVVHPASGDGGATLVHGLLAHCHDLSGINGVLRPGVVHRLDKDTSGLLVVAKNDETHRGLAGQIQTGAMQRQYLALVWGIVNEPGGLIDAPIGRDPKDRQRMAPVPGGKAARTSYTVLDRLADQTVLQCDLDTGRTHQIRVHMKLLGHPVVGDPRYGRRKDASGWPGQALHAWRLGLSHPATGRDMVFFAPPPAYFLQELIRGGAANALTRMAEIERESCRYGH